MVTHLFESRVRRRLRFAGWAVVSILLLARPAFSNAADLPTPSAILQDLRSFRGMGSVLYVGARPEDENTLLLAYLAHGRDDRTAFLSLTRGEDGQNVLGPESGAKLGVIRTQELLAARRLDGGRQFFSRAMDFGVSTNDEETLRLWDQQQVTADMVRVIRAFRPDIIVTRFAPWPPSTNGQQTVSASLAVAAFKMAGPLADFPEEDLPPWRPRRILWNGNGAETNADVVHLEINGNDPVLGISWSELAARSRALQKTQGFKNESNNANGNNPHTESFQLLAGEPVTNDIMDGVDTTWSRVPDGADIGTFADAIIAKFDSHDPAASIPALLELRSRLQALIANDSVVDEKRLLLDKILQECLGLEVHTTVPQAEVMPGEKLLLHHTAVVHSRVPVRWLGVQYPRTQLQVSQPMPLSPDEICSRDEVQTLPAGVPLSQPYWLRQEPAAGMYRMANSTLIGRPENLPVFPIIQVFDVGSQILLVPDEPVEITTNTIAIKQRRSLEVIPPVSFRFDTNVVQFTPGSTQSVKLTLATARDHAAGTVQLLAPSDWSIMPAQQTFSLAAAGDHASFQFNVTAPSTSNTAKLIAVAQINGASYSNQRELIDYPHIPTQLLQPPATIKAVWAPRAP